MALGQTDTGLDERLSQPLNWSSIWRQFFESLQRSLRTFVRTRGCYGCVKMSVHFSNRFVSIREELDPDDDRHRGQDDRTAYFPASPKSEHRSCECCRGPKFIVHVFSEFGPPVPLALDASATVNDLKAGLSPLSLLGQAQSQQIDMTKHKWEHVERDCGPCPGLGHVELDDLAWVHAQCILPGRKGSRLQGGVLVVAWHLAPQQVLCF